MFRASSPDFSSLSPEELDRLEIVLQKQVLVENEQNQRLSGLRRTMLHLQQTIEVEQQQRPRALSSATSHNASPIQQNQSLLTSTDLVQCYICLSIIEILSDIANQSPPVLCADCHRPVCRRCGNYTSPEFIQSQTRIHLENRTHASKWRCRMCIVRREVVRKSGTWNATEDETSSHSPVRLLQKLAAYRTSIAVPSITSSSATTSPQVERKSSIISDSANFFTRLWRSTNQQSISPSPPSASLLASHEMNSSSFDHIPETCSAPIGTSPILPSASATSNRRMSFIREVSSKTSSSSYQTPSQSSSISATTTTTNSKPKLHAQATTSSTITDPSFEDTTSEQPFDTASELFSQSFETNIDSSNPGIVEDQDDEQNSSQMALTYDERQRRINSTFKPMKTFARQLSSLSTQVSAQRHSDSLPSPEASIDVSMAMDCSSLSMLMKQSPSSSLEPLIVENETASVDVLLTEENGERRSSRSSLKNSDAWARKRTLMQRGYEWTTTLDRETSMKTNQLNDYSNSSNMKSLPNSITNSSTHTNQNDISPSPIKISLNSKSGTINSLPSNLLQRRRSSRRLPAIPADNTMLINTNNDNNNNNNSTSDDAPTTSSSTDQPYQPLRENSLSNRSTRSKSIDSETSLKSRSGHTKLSQIHQNQNAKSIDVSNLTRQKSFLIVNSNLLPQRSIDYPCIVRKAQDLSDIVRRRMLYTKINKQQQGDNFSISLEREHIPKVPRKIIIRQDNSIEIALSKPPKLRRHTLSEDYYPESEFGLTQTSAGSSTLGLPMSASISSSTSGDRRKTIETCENIYLHAEESSKLRARTPPSNPHRILLHRDKNDTSIRTNGLGMRIVGGQECEDGSLGCFVTNILPGGPADVQGNIEVGDQILEFNGNSLIDSTYEEVRMLQDQCGDIVQLVVQHNNIRLQINGGQTLSSIEVSRHFETVPRLSSSITRKRRNLPPLPPSLSSSFPKQFRRQLYETVETLEVPNVKELKPILINRGRLLAQIWHDVEDMKLALTVIQASNLPLRSNGDQPYAYITGKMIFEDRGFDMFETKVIHSSNPVYNETFVFHEVETVDVLHLEVLLWDKKQTTNNDTSLDESDEFVGMVQLPLDEANLEDEPRWYELRDRQARKPSASSVTFKSSSADSSESFRKMPPLFKSNKQQERTKSSTDLLIRALNRSASNKRESVTESPSTKRKHSVVQMRNHSPNRKHLQRASIASPMMSTAFFANNKEHTNRNIEEEEEDGEIKEERPRRQSIITIQSEKLKRRISKGILKLFDNRTRRFSDSSPKSPPLSPTVRKLSTQIPTAMDSEDDIESPLPIGIDSPLVVINKSPRHSIISTSGQDEQQSPLIRPIPLQQMPIGQLMLPYIPSSRHSSISGSRKSSAASYCESDDDIDRYFTLSDPQQDEDDGNNNNVHTHTVGPGQVTPRNYENMINDFIHMGQIQLGLIVTKGLLEIDVICAKGLQKVYEDSSTNGSNTEDNPPDTYVKTYLRTGTRRVQKRKTATVKCSYNPEYHSKLKYNACNVMGRRLQVTVWQRARKFEKNHCIGEAFIQLDNLTLTQLTLAWYKLFRENLVESEFYDSS